MGSSSYPHTLVQDVSWDDFLAFLESPEYHRPRYTYDGRDLEIYTTTLGEGSTTSVLNRLVYGLCYELDLDILGCSDSFYSRSCGKGLRTDLCFWFQNERLVRGREFATPDDVPRPELAVEVHRRGSVLDRLTVYAALGFPEIWFYQDGRLEVLRLGENNQYHSSRASLYLPKVNPTEFPKWIGMAIDDGHLAMVRAYDSWVREMILPAWRAAPEDGQGV